MLGYRGFGTPVLSAAPMIERAVVGQAHDTPAEITLPEAGGGIPLLAGGSHWQGHPRTVYAPRQLGEAEIAVELKLIRESESLLLMRLPSLLAAGPVRIWWDWPHSDEWLIPSLVKTRWTLSREMPWGWGVDLATYEPVVEIWDRADLRAPVSTLSRSASSPPGAGEYYVDTASNATEIETPDLSASAGLELACRYHPVRLIRKADAPVRIAATNSARVRLRLFEMVPSRTYVGLG